MTWAQVDEIRERYKNTGNRRMNIRRAPGVEYMSMDKLGHIYGVSGSTVEKVAAKRHPYDDETRQKEAFEHSGDI